MLTIIKHSTTSAFACCLLTSTSWGMQQQQKAPQEAPVKPATLHRTVQTRFPRRRPTAEDTSTMGQHAAKIIPPTLRTPHAETEELRVQIARLQTRLSEQEGIITEMTSRLSNLSAVVTERDELRRQLEILQSSIEQQVAQEKMEAEAARHREAEQLQKEISELHQQLRTARAKSESAANAAKTAEFKVKRVQQEKEKIREKTALEVAAALQKARVIPPSSPRTAIPSQQKKPAATTTPTAKTYTAPVHEITATPRDPLITAFIEKKINNLLILYNYARHWISLQTSPLTKPITIQNKTVSEGILLGNWRDIEQLILGLLAQKRV